MGMLNNVIRTAVVSALGAKLAKGRSPIVAALIALLATRMLSKGEDAKADAAPSQDGLGGLVDQFKRGGLEDIIKSWIGTGPNKPITPNQLHQALGPETIDGLEKKTGLPRDDLLSQLSRLLPDVVDKLTPQGQMPAKEDLLPGPHEDNEETAATAQQGRPI
ncbi:MAG TPA: YidB family protein [Hyphomicrobiaceae bacterium]|jgi:uncharacterized protein YidB (DUF937 family)